MIISNLHTHSFYCGHGHGTILEYEQKAEQMGLKLLGISEHLPLPDNKFSKSRMALSDMETYEEDVKAIKANSKIDVLLGYEADYYPKYSSWVSKVKQRVDYLTFGVHFLFNKEGKLLTPFSNKLELDDLKQYFKQYKDAVESGYFTFAAHPDLFYSGRPVWDAEAIALSKDIITLANEHNLPLEINGNGLIKTLEQHRPNYPFNKFWELAMENNATIIVGFDAHEVKNLELANKLATEFCQENQIEFSQSYLIDGKITFKKDMVL